MIATLRGFGIAAANKRALILGLEDGDLRIGICEGDPVPGELKVKRFLTIDGNGDSVFLLAKLAGVGVTSASDVALLTIGPDGAVMMLAREGDVIEGQPIAVLASLISVPGTGAEARWRSGDDAIGVRLTFSGRSRRFTPSQRQEVDPGLGRVGRNGRPTRGRCAGAQLRTARLRIGRRGVHGAT